MEIGENFRGRRKKKQRIVRGRRWKV